MKNNRTLTALILFAVCTFAWAADSLTPIKGDAEDASFRHLDGKTGQLQDYTGKGKWTIVMIWASDCHVCNQEVHHYVKFHEKHKEKDAIVLGLSADGWSGRAAAQGFVDRHKVTFPNLVATGPTIVALYEKITAEPLPGTPAFLVFDPKGKIAAKQVGPVEVEIIENFIAQAG